MWIMRIRNLRNLRKLRKLASLIHPGTEIEIFS